MPQGQQKESPQFGRVKDVSELGALLRAFRKEQKLSLEKVSGLTNVSMRFLSELERGKETAELGKALSTINKLGLEVIIQPRGYDQRCPVVLKQNEE